MHRAISPFPSPPRTFVCCLLVLCAAIIVPGCRSIQRPERTQTAPARVSPVVRGSGSGLEVWYWVVSDRPVERRPPPKPPSERKAPPPRIGPDPSAAAEDFTARKVKKSAEPPPEPEESDEPPPPNYTIVDDRAELDDLLAAFADRPAPLPDEVLRLWRESGFRVFSVPRTELERIEAQLRLVAPVQRQWMGEMPAWTDIVQGPWRDDGQRVMVGEMPIRLEPGRLRLLARCWTAPVTVAGGPKAGLRLELVPQFELLQSDEHKMLIAAGMLSDADAKGVLFERLAAGTVLTSDDAVIIVPVGQYSGDSAEGPLQAQTPTLGEAMLTRAVTERTARARAVIVLLPRIPERFELLR
jgi:hypothetical protein